MDPELQEDAGKAAGLNEVIEASSHQDDSNKLTRALLLYSVAVVVWIGTGLGDALRGRKRIGTETMAL